MSEVFYESDDAEAEVQAEKAGLLPQASERPNPDSDHMDPPKPVSLPEGVAPRRPHPSMERVDKF